MTKGPSRCIVHVDMDAFYASVEQRDEPSYRGRPVIVGADPANGTGRGVVAACSYEARRYGIHSAQPIREAWRRCPEGVYLRPRLEHYRAVSGVIMGVFRRRTHLVEPLSLDEAFLDVTGSIRLLGSAEHIARSIKDEIFRATNLKASVGVAPSKFLAKIASDLEKPDGLVFVPDDVTTFLRPLPVRRLPGVGPKTEQKLRRIGIRTVGQLAAVPTSELQRVFGAAGIHLHALSQGQDDRPVVPWRAPISISNETTFDRDTDDRVTVERTLRQLSEKVARRLRSGRYRAGQVTLKIRFASFETHTRQVSVRSGIKTGSEVFELALQLFRSFSVRERIRLLGVGATRLTCDDEHAQYDLFDTRGRDEELARVLDAVQNKYGEHSIRRASDLE